MVRISIYNEKGGVGKTTMTAMLASYLAYAKGKSVCVLDFDYPSYHFMELRRSESAILNDPRSPLSIYMRVSPPAGEPYDIFSIPPGPGGIYRAKEVFDYLPSILSEGYDYVFYDFPGRFTQDEAVSFIAANGYLDFMAIPMDTDKQSRRSALVVADAVANEGIPLALFWNRVTIWEAKGNGTRFERGAAPFRERGFEVMDEMVRDLRKFSRESSEMAFIRSTFCFPERYVNQWSPAIIPFLDALQRRIDQSQKA